MFEYSIDYMMEKYKAIIFFPVPLYFIPLSFLLFFYLRETFMVGVTVWLFNSLNEETKRRENENITSSFYYEESSENEVGENDELEDSSDIEVSDEISRESNSTAENTNNTDGAVNNENINELNELTSNESDDLPDEKIKFDKNSSVTVNALEDIVPETNDKRWWNFGNDKNKKN